jgi:murein L,D-transpeptidase YcbB/YkuD
MPCSRLLYLVLPALLLGSPALAQDLDCESHATAFAASMREQAEQEGDPRSVTVRALRPGQHATSLPLLREALGLPAEGRYDEELDQAVARYQAQLGFTPTGTLDRATLMNLLPLSARYQAQVAEHAAAQCRRVNQELARSRPVRFIEVNVASQTLTAYERDAEGVAVPVLVSRVIAGAETTRTPLADFSLWGLKFNPGWTPTPNILARNVVKGGTVNRRWLKSHNMRITNAQGQSVPASAVTAGNWRQFRYSEPAGPGAALGAWKFETTSTQNIYLHDTPEKPKFERNERLASSGCVRVQDIEALARWAFDATEGSAQERQFTQLSATGKSVIRKLPAPIPVYLTYRLVEANQDGQALFYPDSYRLVPGPVTLATELVGAGE